MPVSAEDVVAHKQELFWSRVSKPSPYCCWEWTAGTTPEGYGHFRFDGKHRLVHRLAYRWLVGEIPEGLTLDHLCRNTVCVNPLHLEPVTARVNTLRGHSPFAENARKTHCPQGHPFDEANTYRYDGERHCRVCKAESNRSRNVRKVEWQRERRMQLRRERSRAH